MSAEQTKARILDAAFREFAEYGVAGARVDRIAKSAACNKNLIYVYFGSKEALFGTVLDQHLSNAYAGIPFTADDLPGFARRVFDFAQANPDVYRLLAWATLEHTAALPPAREREHDSTLPLILAQQESGAISADTPPALIMMAVMALATAWSPVFPFGATANPRANLPPGTIRDAVAAMVARIAGSSPAHRLPPASGNRRSLSSPPSAAPPSAATQKEPTSMSPIAGQLVTETLEYDGGRQVTAYVPPAPPEAIVFAGDGQLITSWGGVLETAGLPPTMIIGAHRLDDEMLRLHEYSPGQSTAAFAFDPERFAAHEKFFAEDVRQWARSRFGVALPADRTAVFGVSASGELALAMGLRHPGIYGAVFCASPGGGYRPPAVMPGSLPRAYLVAGLREPFFLKNATRWADALRDAGADVVMTERAGSHGDAFWREEFPLMVAWAFGR